MSSAAVGKPEHRGPLPQRSFAARYRQAMGQYATGVTVVASMVDGVPYGITVNSFTSVSLDPPLVSFCAAHSSSTWPALRQSAGFAVSVLAAGQRSVCQVFAARNADRFQAVDWEPGPGGHPVIRGALAWLGCERVSVQATGDHDLVLAEVTSLDVHGGAPLIFFQSRLGTYRDGTESG